MNRVKIPIRVEWSKVYKHYLLIIPALFILFLENGLYILKQVSPIPAYFFYFPLYISITYIYLLFHTKDLLSFVKIPIYYFIITMLVTNFMVSYYFIYISLENEGAIRVFIFSFMGLFLWDFFMGLPFFKNLTNLRKQDILKFSSEKNTIVVHDPKDINIWTTQEKKRKSIFSTIVLYFSLPFALLGKAGAYYFGTWISHNYSNGLFVVAIILWIASLIILMGGGIIFIVMTLLKLKYPTQEEIEAYKSKGKV